MAALSDTTIDPRRLTPGTTIRYRQMPCTQTLTRRKDDNSGWWLEDGKGLADRVWNGGDWSVVTLGSDPEPDIAALLAWGERPDASSTDRPRVDVWMPRSTPWANLQTLTRGSGQDRREVLTGPPMVNLHLGGMSIGGYLDEMEQYIDAARDALKLARHYATELQARDE